MGTGKKKIEIKMREKGEQRMVTFSKRRHGLFKKAYQLHCLTGAHIASLVFSPAGRPYVHGDPSFDATIGRYLNNTCGPTSSSSSSSSSSSVEEMNGGCGAKSAMLSSCLDGLRVEDHWNVEELILMKEKMEEIRKKVINKIENEFVSSLFPSS